MPSFRREIRTIRTMLAGSRWAADLQVQNVLDEYDRFIGATRLRDRERQTSLQIFFASRAIDSLLAHIVRWEYTRPGGARSNAPRNLNGYIRFIQRYGVNRNHFTRPTAIRLSRNLRAQRNRFMHEAGTFPTNAELIQFLADTLAGITELVAWR